MIEVKYWNPITKQLNIINLKTYLKLVLINGFRGYEQTIPMLYTGQKDGKRTKEYPEGEKIYEGDIVEVVLEYGNSVLQTQDGEIIRSVMVLEGGCFLAKPIREDFFSTLIRDTSNIFNIGNRYKNPDLITNSNILFLDYPIINNDESKNLLSFSKLSENWKAYEKRENKVIYKNPIIVNLDNNEIISVNCPPDTIIKDGIKYEGCYLKGYNGTNKNNLILEIGFIFKAKFNSEVKAVEAL
jgi:hypothetical protein